jgi:hypothetical protein
VPPGLANDQGNRMCVWIPRLEFRLQAETTILTRVNAELQPDLSSSLAHMQLPWANDLLTGTEHLGYVEGSKSTYAALRRRSFYGVT